MVTVTDEEFFKRLASLVKDINNTIHYSALPSNFRGQGRIIELIVMRDVPSENSPVWHRSSRDP